MYFFKFIMLCRRWVRLNVLEVMVVGRTDRKT